MTKISSLTRNSALIAFFFLIDKVLAFGKSFLFNKIVGLEGMGIFGASNNIPDYLSALLSGGALGMAFIPVLREYLDRQGRPAAWELFSKVVNLAFLITAGASIIIILLAEPLVKGIIVPHFSSEKQTLVADLMRLDLVAILLFSISGLVMSSLHANKHFLLPALAPIFYNLGQIFGVTILAPDANLTLGPISLPSFGMGLHGLVYGVILGAILHLVIQIPGLIRYKFRWSPGFGFKTPGVQRVLILLFPRVLTMACIQGYFVARDSIASRFGEAGVGALNLGWTIMQVPETIIGTAIAIALLPTLSELITAGNPTKFVETTNRALRVMLALTLPVAVILAVSVRPLIATFFGFEPAQLDLVTWCTWAFLVGLAGETWLETAVRAFYANQNTRTPLVAAFGQAVIFFILAQILIRWMGLAGIPLAASLTFTLQALILLIILNKKFRGILDIRSTLPRTLAGAFLGGGTTLAAVVFLPISPLMAVLVGVVTGSLVAILFVYKEARLLLHL